MAREFKYKITSECVFRDAQSASKNLTSSSNVTIHNTKGMKCSIESSQTIGKYTICEIYTSESMIYNGNSTNKGYIRKGNLELLAQYKFDVPYVTKKSCTLYKLKTGNTELLTIPTNTKVKALHGSTATNDKTRIYVKVTIKGKTTKGWVEGINLKTSSSTSGSSTKNTTSTTKTKQEESAKKKAAAAKEKKVAKQTKYLKSTINSIYAIPNTTASDKLLYSTLGVTSMTGIYGAPYQFMSIVDRRLHDQNNKNTHLGRAYSKHIISDMPLLLLTPGKVKFLSGFSSASKKNAITALSSLKNISNVSQALSSLLDSDYKTNDRRYYTFGFDVSNYYNYVNPMLWNCAIYLGIGDTTVTIGGYKEKLKKFKWQKVATKYGSYLGYDKFVAFYLDSEKSISQSFSNTTTQSAIANGINEISDTAKEIKFLTGTAVGKQLKIQDPDAYTDILDSIDTVADKYLNGSSLLKNIAQGALTVASGGRLCFPEVWSDSSFAQSYDISMKLRTPDGDTLSWFLNICVPMIHLIAMAAPRQLSGNGYTSPFLVRAFYKGLFNIETGMIDTLSFTKGRESAWNADGLPTEVDVSLSIKDMYNVLFISGLKSVNSEKGSDLLQSKYILKNTGMMDYLSNLCGINVTQPELSRTLEMYLNLTINDWSSRAVRWGSQLQTNVIDAIASIYQDTFR